MLLYEVVRQWHLRCYEQTREGAAWTPGRRAFCWSPGRRGPAKGDEVRADTVRMGPDPRPQTPAENCANVSKIIRPTIKRMTLAAEEARRPMGSLCRDWT